MQGKSWCFTLNNYTEEDETRLQSLPCRYIVYGREQVSTPHLQGYIVFATNKRLSWMKSNVHATAHFETAKGNPQQNRDYCTKDGNIFELGQMPASNKRKGELEKERWEEARRNAKLAKYDDIPADIYLRCRSAIHAIARDHQTLPPPRPDLENYWFFGQSGTGKSLTAAQENPGAYYKLKNKWWDGYNNQSCVIIEEWSPDYDKLADLLKMWADHNAFPAEVKSGYLTIRPTKLIVTSNYTLEECFPRQGDLLPMKRRFKVRHFGPALESQAF